MIAYIEPVLRELTRGNACRCYIPGCHSSEYANRKSYLIGKEKVNNSSEDGEEDTER